PIKSPSWRLTRAGPRATSGHQPEFHGPDIFTAVPGRHGWVLCPEHRVVGRTAADRIDVAAGDVETKRVARLRGYAARTIPYVKGTQGDLELHDVASGNAPIRDYPVGIRQVRGGRVLVSVGIGDDLETLAVAAANRRAEVVGNVVSINEQLDTVVEERPIRGLAVDLHVLIADLE